MYQINWFCDKCNAFLNIQNEFTTSLGKWGCAKCGYVNDLTLNVILLKSENEYISNSIKCSVKNYKDYQCEHCYYTSKEKNGN